MKLIIAVVKLDADFRVIFQVCLSKGWSCQSFNYNSESMKCKLNSCKFGVAGTHLDVTLIDDSSHSYVEVKVWQQINFVTVTVTYFLVN